MPYVPKTWADGSSGGTPILAADLNHIENGLFSAYPVFNVMDPAYGAAGNGTTNDAAAIQAAVNAVPAGGGIVYFPPGRTYLAASTLTLGVPGLIMEFNGSTLKKSATFPSVNYAFNVTRNVTIRNLVQDGNVSGGALGLGMLIADANATDVRLTNCSFNNNFQTGVVMDNAACKVTLQSVRCNLNGVGQSGSGFSASAGTCILDRLCQFDDNGHSGVRVYDTANFDCVVNGTARRNVFGFSILGANPGGRSDYLYGDDNQTFGLFMQNSVSPFTGPSNWSFGHVEMCRTGSAVGGTYTQDNTGTGVQGFGITHCTFDNVVCRGNLGYDFALVQGDATHPSAYNTVGQVTADIRGPSGVMAADNDPAVVLGGGSHHNSFGTVRSYGKTVAVFFGEATPFTIDYNSFDQVFCHNTAYTAVAFMGGSWNYIGSVVARECTMGHPGTGVAQYNAPVVFADDSSVHHNLIDRLDHVTSSGTAYTYLVEARAAAANNRVAHARGAFVTSALHELGTADTVVLDP